MGKAISACDQIALNCRSRTYPLFEPLALAVHAYYSRPFGPNYGAGSLSEDLVPRDHLKFHKTMIELRSSSMVHTDATVKKSAGIPFNDVIYSIHGEHVEFSTRTAWLPIDDYKLAAEHCKVMTDIFTELLTGFYARYGRLFPATNGEFLLCIEDGQPIFVAGYSCPERSSLNFGAE